MKKTRVIALICTIVLLVTMLPLAAFAKTAYVKTKNGASLNVRSKMVTHANNRIATIAFGTRVNVISTTNDWSYISFKNTKTGRSARGYVLSKYLVDSPAGLDSSVSEGMSKVTPRKVTVRPTHDNGWVFMRASTTTNGRIITHYRKGETLTLKAVGKHWAKVYDPRTGNTGYMMKKFLH